jgi:hypothetical protein
MVRRGLGADVEPAFAATCHQLTGGAPFLVEELVRAIAGRGIEPTAAASSRVAALAPHAVSHSVLHRLSRLSAPARELAPATAVLGETDLRLAADLAGVTRAPPQPQPTNSPPLESSNRTDRCVSFTLSSGRRSRPVFRRAGGRVCTRRPRAASRTRARLRTASRPTSWRPTRPGMIGSQNPSCRPPGPGSRTALRTRPSPTCGGRWPNRHPSGSVPASPSSSASPNRTRETRRPGLIWSWHSIPRRERPRRPRSRSLGRMLQIDGRNREALEVFDRTRAPARQRRPACVAHARGRRARRGPARRTARR